MKVTVNIEIDKHKVSLLRNELASVMKDDTNINKDMYYLMQLYEQLQFLM